MPTTMESGPVRCSTRVSLKPASCIHPVQSAPVCRALTGRLPRKRTARQDTNHLPVAYPTFPPSARSVSLTVIYGQAFVVYGLCEYYRAFAHEPALKRAIDLFRLIEQHSFDHTTGGYFETCKRNWSPDNREKSEDHARHPGVR